MQTSLYFRMFSKDMWPTKLKVRHYWVFILLAY